MTSTSRVRAPYDILCRVIGNPTHRPDSGERVSWDVDIDGARARIHDLKDDKPIGVGQNIFEAKHAIWHVEAADDEQLTWVCARLSERVIEAVARQTGARTLDAAAKAELNALLRAGVKLAEAMKRVQAQMQLVDGDARALYQWPMKEVTSPLLFPGALAPAPAPAAADDDDGDGAGDGVPTPSITVKPSRQSASPPPASAQSAQQKAPAKPKVALGPPIPKDMPRGTVDAPFAKLRALLGEPEDRPVPFVSTRWRFVLDESRGDGREIVRHDDEPRDDPRDVDATLFDRMSRFDDPYASRSAPTFQWTLISTAPENIERILAFLDEKLRDG